ncbi:hypothetical protein ASC78_21685 [Variovorax sp. Root318D1]|nr:hypothetical protein ASC78_21685 [Variovorax sp. Root318D1]
MIVGTRDAVEIANFCDTRLSQPQSIHQGECLLSQRCVDDLVPTQSSTTNFPIIGSATARIHNHK